MSTALLLLLGAVVIGGTAAASSASDPAIDDTTGDDTVPDETGKPDYDPAYLSSLVGTDAWTKYDGLFKTYATRFGVPWTWVKAICLNETLLGTNRLYLNSNQGSSDGKSWGIMQMTLGTAISVGGGPITPDGLRDDDRSIYLGTLYLSQLYKMFSGDQESTVKSYNQGPGNTKKGKHYADAYWDRFRKNLATVETEDLA